MPYAVTHTHTLNARAGDLSIRDQQLLILPYLTSRLPTLARPRVAAVLYRGNRAVLVML